MGDAAMIQDQRSGLLRPAFSLAFLYQASRLRMGSIPTFYENGSKDARETGFSAVSARSGVYPGSDSRRQPACRDLLAGDAGRVW